MSPAEKELYFQKYGLRNYNWRGDYWARRFEMNETEEKVVDPKETPYCLITTNTNVNLMPSSNYKRSFHKTVKDAQERATELLTQNRMQKIFIVKIVAEISLAPPPVVVKKFAK